MEKNTECIETYFQVDLQLCIGFWSWDCPSAAIMSTGLCCFSIAFPTRSTRPSEEKKVEIRTWPSDGEQFMEVLVRGEEFTFWPSHPLVLHPFLCLGDTEASLTAHMHKAQWRRTASTEKLIGHPQTCLANTRYSETSKPFL